MADARSVHRMRQRQRWCTVAEPRRLSNQAGMANLGSGNYRPSTPGSPFQGGRFDNEACLPGGCADDQLGPLRTQDRHVPLPLRPLATVLATRQPIQAMANVLAGYHSHTRRCLLPGSMAHLPLRNNGHQHGKQLQLDNVVRLRRRGAEARRGCTR